jgi:hypothetical protein
MTLIIEPGYMQVTDVNGHIVHDTRDQIYHVLTTLNGQIVRPTMGWGASGNAQTRSIDIDLGAVDPACTTVQGLVKLTYSTGYSPLPSGTWLTLGGTIVFDMKVFQSLSGNWATYPSSVGTFDFIISAGHARFQEKLVMYDDYRSSLGGVMAGYTLDYRLVLGAFT